MNVKKMYAYILIPIVIALIIFSFRFWMRRRVETFFYPKYIQLTKNVDIPLEVILNELDNILAEKVPFVAEQLQDGLSPEDIDKLENKSGITLTEELRTFYMWHNGCSVNSNQYFFPGHLFLPLDFAIEQHIQLKKDVDSSPWLQRLTFNIFAGHKLSWLTIFDDMCGDGYFYDHLRKNDNCCIFYNFAEDSSYMFFPSLKNLMAAINECYKQNAFRPSSEPNSLEEDFDKAWNIFMKYGS